MAAPACGSFSILLAMSMQHGGGTLDSNMHGNHTLVIAHAASNCSLWSSSAPKHCTNLCTTPGQDTTSSIGGFFSMDKTLRKNVVASRLSTGSDDISFST
jgi:hypothetical protein